MKDSLGGNPVVKSLSQTRRSAQDDTTRALTQSYEEVAKGKEKSGAVEYRETGSRKRKRSVRITRNDGPAPDVELPPGDRFRANVFIAIVDNLSAALDKRIDAYTPICKRFVFLHKLHTMSTEDIASSAATLVNAYPEHLEETLPAELVQFSAFVKPQFDTAAITDPCDRDHKCSMELQLFQIVSQPCIREAFVNEETMLRIYLSMLVTNCSGERSFSTLSRVENQLRTTMSDNRLNWLSLLLLSIESDLLRNIDFQDIIADFAQMKARKVKLQ